MPFDLKSIEAFDDGLYTPVVGSWAENKYKILHHYDNMFATGMKKRWDHRIYVDLFSSAGIAQIRDTKRFVLTSSLLALNIPDRFNKYIYCDVDNKCLSALSERVTKYYPGTDAHYIKGDCNEKANEILSLLPKPSSSNTVLVFCVVDPYNLGINFDTIKLLNNYRMDFLVLLSWMDASRNEFLYIKPSHERIDNFLGEGIWRDKWSQLKNKNYDFRKFLAEEFVYQMMALGYPDTALKTMHEIRSSAKNLSLYHLAFFSKSKRGYDFWNKARFGGPDQISFKFEE